MRAIAASAARACVPARRCARGRVLRAYQSSRATFRAVGFGCLCPPFLGGFSPPFWVGFSACFSGVGGCACGLSFGGCFGVVVWVGVVGERERQRQPRKGERAQGRTATANGASVNGRTACPFSSVRQILSF